MLPNGWRPDSSPLMGDLPRRVHVVGVGGSGMSGLARLLAGLGHEVTGSDLHAGPVLDRLADAGIDVWSASNPVQTESAELVVASSAVPASDPELRAAAAAGIPVWDRPRLLESLTARMPTIGPTGTHGKTTSTALLISAIQGVGIDPSFVVGGELVGMATNAGVGRDDVFILEIDEAFGTFLELHLRGLIVTNLEADHLDYYETIDHLEDAFVDVVRRVDGPVVACEDDPGARRVARRTGTPTYGTSPHADRHIERVELGDTDVRFGFEGRAVVVPKPGLHMVRNAAGVLALIADMGMDLDAAVEGLGTFRGVSRRFELRGRAGGVTVIDDYAHHPTEIAATLEAARRGNWRRIWAIFQPHRYTRTRELYREFGPAFGAADEVVITGIYGAGETPLPGVTGGLVADAVVARSSSHVTYIPTRADLVEFLVESVREGDVVLTLGAGDITLLGSELLDRLGRR
jgi:UDP-N-acetylmuramate--alanine ligase